MLSVGGRLTLIKSSLSNLPIYYMSLFPMPQGVIDKITQIQRNFLWSGGVNKKSLALIKWSFAQLPKIFGGLNIGNLLSRNLGLLFKWIWRYFQEPKALWRQIIEAKYDYSKDFCIDDLEPLKRGGPWKLLCNSLLKNEDVKNLIKQGAKMRISNGESTRFWHDIWINNSALKDQFPRLFLIAKQPLAMVSSMGQFQGNEWQWRIPWSRELRSRDQEEWDNLFPLLKNIRLSREGADVLMWSHDKSGIFSVKSFYSKLSQSSGLSVERVIPRLWKGLVPFRIEVFFWLALLERLNTKSKLSRLGIIPPDNINCPMCNSWPEDVTHLFLFCPYARVIWGWWWKIWDIDWVWPSSLVLAFEQWSFSGANKFFKKVWTASFQIIVWSLWKERNARIFSNKVSSTMEIQNLILVRLCWWMKVWKESCPYPVEDVLRNPQCLQWGGASLQKGRAHQSLKPSCPQDNLVWNLNASYFSDSQDDVQGGIIGGFLSDEKKKILCLFSCPYPPMNPHAAATIAIHRAIQISISNNSLKGKTICILSASKEAIHWCSSPKAGPPNLQFLLNFIRASHRKGIPACFSWNEGCGKEVNNILLAKRISRFSNVVVWM